MSLPFKAQTVTLQHKNNLWLLQDNELLPGTRGHPERHSFKRLYELRSENVTRDAENWQAQSPTPRHQARVHEPRTERCQEALTVYLIRRGKSRPTNGCSSPSRDGLFFAFFQHSHRGSWANAGLKSHMTSFKAEVFRDGVWNYWVWNANKFSRFATIYVAFSEACWSGVFLFSLHICTFVKDTVSCESWPPARDSSGLSWRQARIILILGGRGGTYH